MLAVRFGYTGSGCPGYQDTGALQVQNCKTSVQSLPEKVDVLCPPGTTPFRGLFFCAAVLRLIDAHVQFACLAGEPAAVDSIRP